MLASAQAPDDTAQRLTVDQARAYMVELVNRDRAAQGRAPVAFDMTASSAAQPHTDEMVRYGYSSHWGVDGKKPDQRYTEGNGVNADSENEYYRGPEKREGQAPPVLQPSQQPSFTRAEMEKIESIFMDEQPPNDGHRSTILDPENNGIGIALSRATSETSASGWPIDRIGCTQEFTAHYGTYGAIPRTLKPGEAFDLTGKLARGYRVQSIEVREEGLPQPMSIYALWHTSSYSSGPDDTIASYFPNYPPAPVSVQEMPDGQSFSTHITTSSSATNAVWKSGLLYVEVWANPTHGATMLVSRRTIVLGGGSSTSMVASIPVHSDTPSSTVSISPAIAPASPSRTTPPPPEPEWTAWIVAKDAAGGPTSVRSRKSCRTTMNANGTHDWTVQFENSDPVSAYQVVAQLVPASVFAAPSDWPTSATVIALAAASTQASSAHATFPMASTCDTLPHLFLSVAKASH